MTTMFENKVEYNDFVKQVENGEVKTADVQSSSGKVYYTLKSDDGLKEYVTNYPYTEGFVEKLLVNNVEVKYKIVGRRAGDIATCYADPSKAKKELGWVAEKGIEDMCKDSWNFIVSNK